jgi:hypothetical protein
VSALIFRVVFLFAVAERIVDVVECEEFEVSE